MNSVLDLHPLRLFLLLSLSHCFSCSLSQMNTVYWAVGIGRNKTTLLFSFVMWAPSWDPQPTWLHLTTVTGNKLLWITRLRSASNTHTQNMHLQNHMGITFAFTYDAAYVQGPKNPHTHSRGSPISVAVYLEQSILILVRSISLSGLRSDHQ